MKHIWSGFIPGVIIASCMPMQPMAAQENKQNDKRNETVNVRETPSGAPTFAPADSTTERTIIVGDQTIHYRAIAGTLTVGSNDVQDAMLGPDGKAQPSGGDTLPEQATARMFYVAYFKKDAGSRRPITFMYNGGPGASSLPLHMGAFGPRRVVVPDGQPDPGAPYNIINNDYTLLDASDIVFVDAPGTGFGRIMGPGKETAFWGDDPDMHAFERFIRRFLSQYDKWNSSKYLLGESYGTLRNAMLVADLRDVHFNGLIMLSQILDFDNNADGQQLNPGPEEAYALALPTYAAVAFYHHKLPAQPAELEPFLDEVKQYALSEYMSALLQGSELTDARRDAVAEKLHDYTGLPREFLLKANLRVRAAVFMKMLLSDNETITGRLDGRYQGQDLDPLSEDAENDPTLIAILPAYTAAFNQYVRTELRYGNDQTYKVLLTKNDKFVWDWRHGAPGGPPAGEYPGLGTNVMPDLAYAMKLNPKMKVMLAGGYYDLTTPFFGGIYEMHHLPVPKNLQSNISYHYYAGGHMVYVHEDALRQFHSDVAAFIKGTETTD